MKIELSPRGERTCRIPRIDPDAVQATANENWGGDTEKVATTTVEFVEAEGIRLESWYDKADEYETMLDMLEWVPPALRRLIEKIWCDSKATSAYTVNLHAWHPMAAHAVAEALEVAALGTRMGGHNGISVEGPELHTDLEDWDDDEEEIEDVRLDPQWMEYLLEPLPE